MTPSALPLSGRPVRCTLQKRLRLVRAGAASPDNREGERQMFPMIFDSEMIFILSVAVSSGITFYLIAAYKLSL